jgi:DNA-binding NtrC family response regulator
MSLEGRTIAVVEDDPIMGESLVDRLSLEGAKVHWWQTCRAAETGLGAVLPDLIVCDIRLPDGTGEDVFRTASSIPDMPPFLFVTAFGDIGQAVRLMRNGAGDYVTKPFDTAAFLARLIQLLRTRPAPGGVVLGVSPDMRAVERLLQRIAKLTTPVLVTGETGSGKEVCARFLHGVGAGATGPFMAVNCAAIPKDLMESELFGHERGAFTGATSRHRGYAERAGTGTLFLDEIGELDLKLQTKLLRLVEDRTFYRVGGEEVLPFRARLVCATNAELTARVRQGLFREDLLYRINVLSVPVPALRQRRDDLEWLANRFFVQLISEQETELRGVSALAVQALHGHAWPGNVRELRNRMERAVALALGEWIMPADLFPEARDKAIESAADLLPLALVRDEAERRQIERALRCSGGQIADAAARLGISRTTMWEKMRRHGIEADGVPER